MQALETELRNKQQAHQREATQRAKQAQHERDTARVAAQAARAAQAQAAERAARAAQQATQRQQAVVPPTVPPPSAGHTQKWETDFDRRQREGREAAEGRALKDHKHQRSASGVETQAQREAREKAERDAAALIDDRLFDREATRLAQQRARDLAAGKKESDRPWSYYMMGSFEDGEPRTAVAGQNAKEDDLLIRDVKKPGPNGEEDDFSEENFSDRYADPRNHAHLSPPRDDGDWYADLRDNFEEPDL